jgi:hypothetical protein
LGRDREGIRDSRPRTQLIGNYSKNGIRLLAGDISQADFDARVKNGDSGDPNQPFAENTLVVGNSGGTILVGEVIYPDNTMPVKNTRLEANSATVQKVPNMHVGTQEVPTTDINYGTPKKLTTADVGLNAPDPSCK